MTGSDGQAEARLQQRTRAAHRRLGANIRQACEQAGLSQEELARLARCGGVRRLARIEAGHGAVPVLILDKLARALGVPMAHLLAGAPDAAAGNHSRTAASAPKLLRPLSRRDPETDAGS